METKQYSIEVGGCLEDGWIVLFEGFFHAEFRDEQDAKEYVEFKNRKKIDKNIKAELIKAFNIKSKHSEFEEINNKWKQIVKAIELLECE